MKIGIMTFWWSEDNYGQLLQCYALQKYLHDAGHYAYLIRYDPRNDYIKTPIWKKAFKAFNPIKLYKFIILRKLKMYDLKEKRNNPRKFGEFRNKYIKQSEKIYYSYHELTENPPEADVYIAGSDQIWNTFGVPTGRAINVIKAYLLDFGNSTVKRTAYAASFGKEQLESASVAIFTQLLRNFNYISVREENGLKICKQCGVDNAELVPDPTMLLSKDIYRTLYDKEVIIKPNKPYVFLYYLGNECDFSINLIFAWAKKKGLEIVYVTANLKHDNYPKTYATIPEWIYLIDHAEYVITNSYHGSVFSIIFGKKFAFIPMSGSVKYMNGRLITLFRLFDMEERFADTEFSILDKEIDWDLVSLKLQGIKNICKQIRI